MMRSLLFLSGMLVAALPAAQPGPAYGATPAALPCTAPPELIHDDPLLVQTARHFHEKLPVTIVAIGGASTAGRAAGDGAEKAYPHWLEEALRRRHPGVAITVLNKGVARQTTEDMVRRFAADVYPNSPTLVVWETGTVDAVHGVNLDAFASALEAGIAALRQHNLDIMVMDMQYNPSTASVINFEPYLETMHRVADLDDIYLFRRFDIMKYWSDTGVFDFVDVPKEKRTTLATDVYKCLGERLAEAIDFATR